VKEKNTSQRDRKGCGGIADAWVFYPGGWGGEAVRVVESIIRCRKCEYSGPNRPS
jgi:hypothetical protein